MNITYEEARIYIGKTCKIQEIGGYIWYLKIKNIENHDSIIEIIVSKFKRQLEDTWINKEINWGNFNYHVEKISILNINEKNI